VPVESVKEFERDYLEFLKNKHADALKTLKAGKLTDEVTDILEKVAVEVAAKFQA
jgi:F-type H+-transporting ATPase subunit alpha